MKCLFEPDKECTHPNLGGKSPLIYVCDVCIKFQIKRELVLLRATRT
jgi:hypothetical protein